LLYLVAGNTESLEKTISLAINDFVGQVSIPTWGKLECRHVRCPTHAAAASQGTWELRVSAVNHAFPQTCRVWFQD